MKRTPLIILNGFLGAGKTTLLKNLLTQAHKRRMTVSVIVNDMSELDVDGVLIANTEIVDAASNNFVSISADSISSRSGIQKLDSALKNLLEKRSADFILLETSGSSHPLPLVRYLREHTQVSLKAFLSLVDTVMLNDDYDGGKKLIPVFQEHLNKGTRGVESLLAEQIMFCNKLLLTKNDRLPFYVVTEVARAIHPLNPQVAIMAVPWGNLQLDELLSMPDYVFHRVALLIDELQDAIDAVLPDETDKKYDISWRVIEDDRPFHPQRLWDTCHRFMGAGVYRSKGFFWLPGRDDLALLWNQAAGSINLEFISYWKAGVLTHTDNSLTKEERAAIRQQLAKMPGRFGDRRCRLTVIGESGEIDDFALALRQCLLTEEEILWWQQGGIFHDPWPTKVARLA
ncbi:TPA: GTP-binding protein [Klebsiella pneumoniae]|nr:GTP-binding protein [Klebsiella pneumoniae]HDT3513838.1 GTP-binding protein [Klebsiella pneumoniae subsp. pneumoniae]